MDLNHDGRISVIELTKAARYLGYNPTKKEAEEMISDCNPARKSLTLILMFGRRTVPHCLLRYVFYKRYQSPRADTI